MFAQLTATSSQLVRDQLPEDLGEFDALRGASRTLGLFAARDGYVQFDGSGSVERLVNMRPGLPDLTNATVSEQPGWTTDADLGRPCLTFLSSSLTNLQYGEDDSFDYRQPFTHFHFAKKTVGTGDADEVIAGYFNGTSHRGFAGWRPTTGANLQHWHGIAGGDAIAQTVYTDAAWNLIIASYSGADAAGNGLVRIQSNDLAAVSTSTGPTPVTLQSFYLGQPGDDGSGNNLAPDMSWDAGGILGLDVFAAGDEAAWYLAQVRALAAARYGALIALPA